MNWKRLLIKAGQWLIRKGSEEALKELRKRQAPKEPKA